MTDVIDPANGEYRQDVAEQSNTDRTKKSGVQINIDESNAANEKLDSMVADRNLPNSFDKTEAGQEAHLKKFGAERGSEGGESTTEESTLDPARKALRRNQK